MNWICNCSLYNTLVLVVYIILLSERGSEAAICESRVVVKFRAFHAAGDSRSRGVRRDYLAFLAHVGRGAFDNANAGWNTRKQTVFWSNLNCKFDFFTRKRTVGAVLD